MIESVRALKAEPGKNILTDGSSQLVHALLAHDLVDELHLTLYPLTLGSGKRVLPNGVHATFALDVRETISDRRSWLALCASALEQPCGRCNKWRHLESSADWDPNPRSTTTAGFWRSGSAKSPSSSPSIIIDSLDVDRGLRLVEHDRPALIEYLAASVSRLAAAGADFAAMAANTPHVVFDELVARSPIPMVSIVEACAEEAARRGLHRLALLGTRFTMEGAFYPAVFARRGIAIVAPNDEERRWIHERYVGRCSAECFSTRPGTE